MVQVHIFQKRHSWARHPHIFISLRRRRWDSRAWLRTWYFYSIEISNAIFYFRSQSSFYFLVKAVFFTKECCDCGWRVLFRYLKHLHLVLFYSLEVLTQLNRQNESRGVKSFDLWDRMWHFFTQHERLVFGCNLSFSNWVIFQFDMMVWFNCGCSFCVISWWGSIIHTLRLTTQGLEVRRALRILHYFISN